MQQRERASARGVRARTRLALVGSPRIGSSPGSAMPVPPPVYSGLDMEAYDTEPLPLSEVLRLDLGADEEASEEESDSDEEPETQTN